MNQRVVRRLLAALPVVLLLDVLPSHDHQDAIAGHGAAGGAQGDVHLVLVGQGGGGCLATWGGGGAGGCLGVAAAGLGEVPELDADTLHTERHISLIALG